MMGRADARDRITRALAQAGAASRAQLARCTSPAPSTVSTIIGEPMSEGLVVEQSAGSVPAASTNAAARPRCWPRERSCTRR